MKNRETSPANSIDGKKRTDFGRLGDGRAAWPAMAVIIIGVAVSIVSGCRQNPTAVALEELTGCHTRVVWCQDWDCATDLYADRPLFKLMGFDSRSRRGEHWILKEVGNYARPMLTARGTHIVYSDRQARTVFVVDWGGKRRRELVEGFAFDTWLDTETGVEWVYYGSDPVPEPYRQDIKAYEAIMRIPIDGTGAPELVWNKTMLMQLSENNVQVSSDGKQLCLITPVGMGVASLPNGEFENIGAGCWPSLAPGPDFLFWHFNGGHRTLSIYERGGANKRDMPINTPPGINGMEVFHPRWSNHPRFMGMDGPLAIRGGGAEVEVYVGRFDAEWKKIEAWVKVSDNTNADFFVDVWLESGMALSCASSAAPAEPQTERSSLWPSDRGALVFAWLDRSPASGMIRPSIDASYAHTAQPRGHAHYGPHQRMELAAGSFVVTPKEWTLAGAFAPRNEFTVAAVLVPATIHGADGASIMEFANETGRSDFVLEQRGSTLGLRLRKAGDDGLLPASAVSLGEVPAGQPVNLVVTYGAGTVTVYRDGERSLVQDVGPIDCAAWSADRIVFGSSWGGSRDWLGRLEGVAIHRRQHSADEIVASADRLESLMSHRPVIEHVTLKAKLIGRSEIPAPKAILPYRRSLAINLFDVVDPMTSGLEEKRLNVAQWVIMDKQVTEASDRKLGTVFELTLAPFDTHAQLKSERISRDAEDLLAPLYYDINSACR